MKIRDYIILLAVMSVAFGANSTSGLTNTTSTLNYGDCLNVSYDGMGYAMVCAPNLPQLNLNKTLAYGETYSNPSIALNVTAPPFPTMNASLVTSDAPVTYTNNTVVVTCAAQNKGVNRTLDFGETFTNSYYGINITAPQFPKVNINRQLEWGEYTTALEKDPRFNYTISCRYFNNQTLIDAQTKASQCDSNLTSERNQRVQLLADNTLLSTNLNATRTELANLKNTTISTKGLNCNSSAIILCPDLVAPMCTDTEKLNGKFGDCISRITQEANDTKNTYTVENAKLTGDLQQCRSGEQNQKEIQENMMVIIAGIVFIAGGAFLAAMYLRQKKVKEES